MSFNKSAGTAGKNTEERYEVKHALVNYFLLVMFTLFPLFFTNAYFNIRHDKYYFFLAITGVLVVAEFLIMMTTGAGKAPTAQKQKAVAKKPPFYKTLSFTDWAFVAFLAVNIISTVFSEDPLDAFFGTSGRNNGLLLMMFYTAMYFAVTRCFKYFEYVFTAFAFGSMLVCLLAVLNAFYIDPLGMFNNLGDEYVKDFTSTIGNKNLLSSYLCILLPVMVSLTAITEKLANRIIYLVACGFGFAALMTADSDSGILGVGVFMVIYFVWFSHRISRLKRFFLASSVMLVGAKLVRLFSLIMGDNIKELDGFQQLFVYSNVSWVLLAACAVITAALYLLDFKKPGTVLPKAVPIALGIFFGLCFAGAIGVMIYFSCFDTSTDLGNLSKLLRFNDKWGTHRGFMWIRSMQIFKNATIFQELFGVGPDMFYDAFSPYFSSLLKYGDSSTNAAHNEYINYLITIGVTGLAAYLAIVGGAIARAVKYAKSNPVLIVCVSAVICYSVQAVVNLYQPITTPLFFIFIALCEAFARSEKSRRCSQPTAA